MNGSLRLFAAIAAVLLWANCTVAKDIDERKWILMESGNFSIYSSVSKRKTRDLMLHLEALRGVFVGGLVSSSKLDDKPTRILVLGRSSDYKKLGMPENSVGSFRSDLRNNYIVISNSSQMSESQVILHEYVHFMVRATQRFPYPKWWDEGYAEYVSSSNLSKKRFEFGLPLEGRLSDLSYLTWLPWEDVLTSTSLANLSRKQNAAYYAQSWLLVHYLHNRGKSSTSIDASWSSYLQKIRNGTGTVPAFEQSFGISVQELKKEIRRYAKNGKYQYWRISTETLVPEFNPSSERVTQRDIQILLGQFALRNHDATAAIMWFRKAIDIQPQSAVAVAGLGSALFLDGHLEDAKIQFDIALDSEPDNPDILVDAAKLALERASLPDAWFTQVDRLKDAETMLMKARSIAGGTVELDTYLAFTWLKQNDDPSAAIELLVSVMRRSPSEQWPLLLLAECYARAGNPDNAIDLAQAVIRYDHRASNYSVSARKLIEQIRGKDDKANGPRPRIAAPQLPKN